MTEDPSDSVRGIVAVGDVIADKYRVEGVLGVGGMGVVVVATHLDLDERVAVKFLKPEALQNAEAVTRFAREARAAVKIKSEHVARVMDVGRLPSGAPFMVMEHLAGEELAALMERQPLSVDTAVRFVLQAAEAVAEAHAIGIIHRDLKPGNLFVTTRADGTTSIKVLDFGISKIRATRRDEAATRSSAVMGTPLYMSPEQLNASRDVDARSDIWALGAILHELVAGTPPFDFEELAQICTAVLHHEPAPITRTGVPSGLASVIRRCLEKDPARRYQDLGELAAALAPFGSTEARASADRIARVLASMNRAADPLRDSSASGAHRAPVIGGAIGPATGGWTLGAGKRGKGATVALLICGFSIFAVAAAAVLFVATRPSPPSAVVAAPEPVKATPAPTAAPTVAAAAPSPATTAAPAPTPVEEASAAPTASARAPVGARPRPGPAKPAGGLFRDRN